MTDDAAPEPSLPTQVGDASQTSAPPAIPPARYILGREIARGGMGRVVEATDTLLGRVVALKEALATDRDALERFARETRITARLEHPSIVPVHDGGMGPNGTPYYVMRMVEGQPLEHFVARASTLNDRLRLIPHIVATAQAVAHAHERGIVHRDLKPSNILVGDLGETILIDWGLAKVIGEVDEPSMGDGIAIPRTNDLDTIKTRAGIVFGTPGFMAPEQLRGGAIDPRWDVYALGATLYHLLSRKPPHFAKTADEMMRAAIEAPPTPIGELVPGVPPELSTIIDKSLAYDPAQRYQDARAVAQDLQAFLTGRLVTAHHYTPRERIVRFVKQHRVEFSVAGAAFLVLLLLGTVAVVRVVRERDRADRAARIAIKAQRQAEDKRLEAERSSEELRLSQARLLASSNPTQAIALLRPLAEKRWREVRTIAAQARASGVAWSLPASARTRSLELSPDGLFALTAGEDGLVRVYDLEARTARTLIDAKGPAEARFADDASRVLLWSTTTLSIIERASGAHREIATPTAIAQLDVSGNVAYWTDAAGALWQLDLAGTTPVAVPLDERVTRVACSPDGRWLALAGELHLLLFDRTEPASPPHQMFTGAPAAIDWATDSSHLAMLFADQAIGVRMQPSPAVMQRMTVGQRGFVLASGDRMFTVGPTGVGVISLVRSGPRKQLAQAIGLEEARGGSVIAAGAEVISVLSDGGDHLLAAPGGRFGSVRASPRSPYVVATHDDRLLVWNLDDIEPRVVAKNVATSHWVSSNDVLVTSVDAPARWIDLRTGTTRPLALGALSEVASSPSGQYTVGVDLAHRAVLLAPGQEPRAIDGHVDRAGFATDTTLVVATDDGAIDRYDVPSATRSPLFRAKAPLASLAWTPTAIAAQLADNTLWRIDLATGTATTTSLARSPTSNLRFLADGSVIVALGTELMRWPGTGAPAHVATLPREITSVASAAPDLVLAITDDGALFSVAAGVATDLHESLGRSQTSMSALTGIMVALDRGSIIVVDPRSPPRWTLASPSSGAYAGVQIANDGHRVLARSGSTAVVWTLDLPASSAETAAWLDKLTNATTGTGGASLGWR